MRSIPEEDYVAHLVLQNAGPDGALSFVVKFISCEGLSPRLGGPVKDGPDPM